ncbi:MAG: N-acetylmuramoyl-L-alanine amidase, partial [Verrucomicrobiota bacterium]
MRSVVALVGLAGFGVCFGYFAAHQSSFSRLLGGEVEQDGERRAEVKAVRVVIDAGHGGKDGGAQGSGLLEKKMTLDVAQRVRRELAKRGIRSVLTREEDETLSLSDRVKISDQYRDAIFVSVHFNTSSTPSVSGLEVYHTSPKSLETLVALKKRFQLPREEKLEDDRNRVLAEAMQASVARTTDVRDRGVRNRSFYVTRNAMAPSVLVECAYLTNKGEAGKVKNPHFRNRISQGIADGVEAYFARVEAYVEGGGEGEFG